VSDNPLKYTPRRAVLLREFAGSAPERFGYQTTDGVPTHLILGGRAVSEATNRDFRRMLAEELVITENGRVRITGWGLDHKDAWHFNYNQRDFDKQRAIDLHA
jgi:hypothetical protein